MNTQEATALNPPNQSAEDPNEPQVLTMKIANQQAYHFTTPGTKGGRALTGESVKAKPPAGCPFSKTVSHTFSTLYQHPREHVLDKGQSSSCHKQKGDRFHSSATTQAGSSLLLIQGPLKKDNFGGSHTIFTGEGLQP